VIEIKCKCFKDKKFSVVTEICSDVRVGTLKNPDAYGYPEIVYIPLILKLNYCPQCGVKLEVR
jgi:hypothetical protein